MRSLGCLFILITITLSGATTANAFPAGTVKTIAVNKSYLPNSFVYPLMTPRTTSNFGIRVHPILRFSKSHHGIDLAAPLGAPIRAVAGGTVVFADPYAGYGNFVVIQHNRRLTSHYGHCEKINVKPGQIIKAGEIIGTVGNSGLSTGPHLHFEIRVDGEPKNPENFIPGLAEQAQG